MDDPLYCILSKVRERPNLYLYEKSLRYLSNFIRGYTCRALELNPNYHDCLSGKGPTYGVAFEAFVYDYFKTTDINFTKNWTTIISENSISQAEAFDKFYELLDEFLEIKEVDPERGYFPLGRPESQMDVLLYSILKDMCERTGLYFEKKSHMYPYHFIVGYTTRALESDPNYHDCFNGIEFDEFVSLHFYGSEITKTKKWITVISENNNSELEAFDSFCELFHEFLKTKEYLG